MWSGVCFRRRHILCVVWKKGGSTRLIIPSPRRDGWSLLDGHLITRIGADRVGAVHAALHVVSSIDVLRSAITANPHNKVAACNAVGVAAWIRAVKVGVHGLNRYACGDNL